MKLLTFCSLFSLIVTNSALAHFGHLGELAGHAHWIGLGATVIAGALAASLAKGKDEKREEEEPASEEQGESA